MQLGAFGLGLSVAMGSLVLAGILAIGISPRRSTTLLLAICGAATIVSSHGYVQFSLLLWAAPALLLPEDLRKAFKEGALALILAILIAGVFLVPWIHFWPQAAKFVDPTFDAAQPLMLVFSNLVISDWSFYLSTTLHKWPFPYLYNLFIGWIPAGLAILALPLCKGRDRRAILFLVLGAMVMFWFASAAPMRALSHIFPGLATLRHTPIFASLAVPAILGCSGYALHHLLRLGSRGALPSRVRSSYSWWRWPAIGVVAIGLIVSLKRVADFALYPLATVDRAVGNSLISQWEIRDQWVAFPWGEHLWVEMGIDLRMKVTGVATPWWWDQRPAPDPYLEVTRYPTRFSGFQEGSIRGIPVFKHPDNAYATVISGDRPSPCEASANGGDITVTCITERSGVLIVRENSWNGWRATEDGNPIPLIEGRWLSVQARPGSHNYRFEYRPWDAGIGASLSTIGLLAVALLWAKKG
jgi:hypothetical protein